MIIHKRLKIYFVVHVRSLVKNLSTFCAENIAAIVREREIEKGAKINAMGGH